VRQRRRLGAGTLALLLASTAGCVDFGDDTDDASTTTGPPTSVVTQAPGTTLAPLSTWPAGVVWGDFADGTVEFNLPVEPGASPVRSAVGPGGRVAVGRTVGSSGALGAVDDLSTARIWFQEGEAWEVVEDTGLPNGTSALYDVAAWSGGYVAVGFYAPAYERHATAVVLTSADGRAWRLTSELPSTWSGWGSRVRITSTGAVLVEVSVAVCNDSAQFVNDPAQVSVPALWTAVAPTGTYDELPATALAALSPERPTPADAAGCFTDYFTVPDDERAAAFGTRLGSIAAIGTRLVVLDPSATTLSVTDDLTEWSRVELPDAVEEPLGSLLYADANGRINVVAVSHRPLGAGYVAGTTDPDAWIATAWVETDGGALQRVAPWRPLYAKNLTFVQLEQREGVVRLIALAPSGTPGAPAVVRIAESGPTAPQPPPTCTPGPLADCNFATLDGAQLAGADLAGIQLYAATINGAALDNANLDSAQLARATITGTSLTGAYLTTANLLGARFDQANLTGASLAYADLTAASFTGTVLTGAILDGAAMDGTTVDTATTCPNGQPPSPNAGSVIAAACGL
jgi:hypothetical protein